MNFTINQTNGIRETVNSEFINKLHNLFITNKSSHTISLSGYLYSPTGYKAQMDALNSQYGPDLVIEVPAAGQYILIEDPAVLQILLDNNISSDGIGISVADANTANFTGSTFKNNTDITSFNSFNYFTRANTNPPKDLFRGCTNLESINLSEATKISDSEFQGTSIVNINAPNLGTLSYSSFSNCKSLQSITNLGNISIIPDSCFANCDVLETVILPSGCTTIGGNAFSLNESYWNKPRLLKTVNGINKISFFGNSCFCRQSSLEIGENDIIEAVGIGNNAFWYVKVTTVNCPKLNTLGDSAFRENSYLLSVRCLGKISSIPTFTFASCTGLQTAKIPYECTHIKQSAFYKCSSLTQIKQYTSSVDNWVEGTDPSYGDITRVTIFDQCCFAYCSSLILNANVLSSSTSIKQEAFRNCTLLTGVLNLPNLITLEQSAFFAAGITGATDLGSITEIPQNCFQYSGLQSITLPSTCTTIKSRGLSDMTTLTTVNGMSNVTTIEGYAFYNDTNLSGALNLPSLTTLGESAFQNCTSITSIANLGNINTIPVNCFRDCSNLTSVIFPTTIRTFNNNCFNGCKIGQIILPYGYIGNDSWAGLMKDSVGANCRYLQYPSTTQVVGTIDMFRDSGNAINCLIVVQATTPPTIGYDPNNTGGFGNGFNWGRPNIASWYVPDSVVNDYKSATGWSQFADKIYPISQLQTDSPTYWQVYQANKDYGVPQNNS